METTPVLSGLHFWARDIERTIAFYRAIGLEIDDPFEGEFVNATLANGLSLAIGSYPLTHRYDPSFVPPNGSKGAVALQFDLETRAAVDEMYQRLTSAGHAGHLAPIDAFWGSRYAEVSDPDGNVVGFHSPREALVSYPASSASSAGCG